MLAVSDVLILSPASDGVLVVADAGDSKRGAVAHLREQMDQVESKIVGSVLNNFDPAHAKYYPSYYHYDYHYRYAPEREKAAESPNGEPARLKAPEDIWR